MLEYYKVKKIELNIKSSLKYEAYANVFTIL
jgi:hypothetical protein